LQLLRDSSRMTGATGTVYSCERILVARRGRFHAVDGCDICCGPWRTLRLLRRRVERRKWAG